MTNATFILVAAISFVLVMTTPAVGFQANRLCLGSASACQHPAVRIKNREAANWESKFILFANDGSQDNADDDKSGSVMTNLMKDTEDLTVGDWVVARRDVPSLGIRSGAAYKILSIFLKGASPKPLGQESSAGLGVEVIPLESYGDDNNDVGSSYTKYLRVYNPRDHDRRNNYLLTSIIEKEDGEEQQGVVVTPEEIGLVSVKADWTEALLLAVPGFFWVFVAMAFSNYYTDRYGGSFFDAFFRT